MSQVTSSRRLRVHKLSDESAGFPDQRQRDEADGLADVGLTFHMLQNNGLFILGLQEVLSF